MVKRLMVEAVKGVMSKMNLDSNSTLELLPEGHRIIYAIISSCLNAVKVFMIIEYLKSLGV